MPVLLPSLRARLLASALGRALRAGLGLAWLLGALAMPAQAMPPLVLGKDTPSVEAWPSVTVHFEAPGSAALTLEQAWSLARGSGFTAPTDRPHANFGPETRTLWMRVPLRLLADGDPEWVLSLDYPSLDLVDLWLVDREGMVLHQDRVGDTLSVQARSLPSRALASALNLPPGGDVDLMVRVRTTSTMIVPLKFWQPAVFHAAESRQMLQQGLLLGISVCLFVYAFLYWLSTRERMYLFYATTVASNSMLFLAFHGVGAQHIWGSHPWITANIAPAATLITVAGSAQFITLVLGLKTARPAIHRVLQGLSIACVAFLALYVGGVLSYRAAQTLATVTGCLPMMLAMPESIQQARRGNRAARFLLSGWLFYAVCIFITAGLLRGWLDANHWVMHALQFGATLETMTWLLVLALRTQESREAAELARQERDLMHSLAHTDVLTGLRNRRGLVHALEERLGSLRRQGDGPMALYLLDLDGFKPVNDRLGHDAGDVLLQRVAERLSAAVRTGDVVARLGGDEFVVLAPGLRHEADAQAVGAKLQAAFEAPFTVAEHSFAVGATVGCALAPLHGLDGDTLLREADAAMYRGKEGGKSRLVMASTPVRTESPPSRPSRAGAAAKETEGEEIWHPAI